MTLLIDKIYIVYLTSLSRWYLNISRPQGRKENLKLLIQNPKMKNRMKQGKSCLFS